MRRLSVASILGLCLFILLPLPNLAYSGVEGRVYDRRGNPWSGGGQVYVFRNDGLNDQRLWASGALDSTGRFTLDWCQDPLGAGLYYVPCTPTTLNTIGLELTLVVVYNNTPDGITRTAELRFLNHKFIAQRYHAGSIYPSDVLGSSCNSYLPSIMANTSPVHEYVHYFDLN